MSRQVSNRVRVKRVVSLSPGVHLRELQRVLGMSFNSVRYHVDRLTDAGEIVRVEEGGYSRLYPAGTSEAERTLFAVVRSETDRKILTTLSNNKALTNRQLCDLAGFAKSTVSEHLTGLVRLGVVKTRQFQENVVAYELDQPERIRALLVNHHMGLLNKATSRFIDLWDF